MPSEERVRSQFAQSPQLAQTLAADHIQSDKQPNQRRNFQDFRQSEKSPKIKKIKKIKNILKLMISYKQKKDEKIEENKKMNVKLLKINYLILLVKKKIMQKLLKNVLF